MASTGQVKSIDEIVQGIVSDAVKGFEDNPVVNMFFIEKHVTKELDNMYEVYTTNIDDLASSFRQVLRNNFGDLEAKIEKKDTKYRSFMEVNVINEDTILVMPSKEVWSLNHIADMIKQKQDLEQVHKIKNFNKISSYAVEIDFNGRKMVGFTKYSRKFIISKKSKLAAQLHQDTMRKVKDDVFTFDEYLDCLYDQDTGHIIIFDPTGFERIFNFKEFYKKKTSEVLTKLKKDLITIDDKLLLKASEKLPFSRKITKLLLDKKLDGLTLDYFQQHKDLLKDKIHYSINGQKIEIKDESALKDFIRVWADDYVKGIISNNTYVSDAKDPL